MTEEKKKPDLEQVKLDDDDEYAQAARILVYVTAQKAEIKTRLDSLDVLEKDARATIEDALGGPDGPAAEALFEGRPIVRWSKFAGHRLNQKALKAERPEVFAKYYDETVERKFVIVPPAPKEES